MAQTTARLPVVSAMLLAAALGAQAGLAAQTEESPSLLTDAAGRVVRAELVPQGEQVFVRDAQVGEEFPEDWFSLPHSDSFRTRSQETGPLLAAIESVYLFHAGEDYRWYGSEEAGLFASDAFVRGGKLALAAFSAIAYYRTVEANRAVAQSIEFLNADARRARFRQRRAEFQAIAGLTAFVFLAYATYVYMIHGTDSNGRDLSVNAEPMSLQEYLDLLRSPQAYHADPGSATLWRTNWAICW